MYRKGCAHLLHRFDFLARVGRVDVPPVLEQQLGDVAAVDRVLLAHQQNQKLPDQNVRLAVDDLCAPKNKKRFFLSDKNRAEMASREPKLIQVETKKISHFRSNLGALGRAGSGLQNAGSGFTLRAWALLVNVAGFNS
jgi:hypothetical protein